jgi:hypothetical protein
LVDGGEFGMSESEGQNYDSPLLSERGVTTISDTVVSQVVGMAAQGIEYNKNILQTVEEVRRRITERVEGLTGLRIKELNATITDITFPEKEARRPGSGSSTSKRDDTPEEATAAAPESQPTPVSESSEPGERETAQVEATTRTEEEASVEDRPPEEAETAEVRTVEQPTDEASEAETESPEEAETLEEETSSEPEISEPGSAEARRRRRAEERTRRRRERSQDS